MAIIDTEFSFMAACKIQPVKANFNDQVESTLLGIKLFRDDLRTHAVLSCALMDDDGNIYQAFNVKIEGEDYQNWNGDNLYPFNYVGNQFNLTFI